MNITCEQFVDRDAEPVQELIIEPEVADWLQVTRPGAYEQYNTPELALASIASITGQQSGPIWRRDEVVGLWQRTPDVQIMQPGSHVRRMQGDRVDYWAWDLSLTEHREIGRILLDTVETPRAVAVLSPTGEDWSIGLTEQMTPVGAPERIRVPLRDRVRARTYGLSRDPRTLQVYETKVKQNS